MKRYLVLVIVSFGIFTSCGIRETYKSPTVNKDIYREISSDTNTIADISWKDYFTDSYLQSLINEGLNNNFDLKIALARLKKAEAQLGQTKAAFFPDLSVFASADQKRFSMDSDILKEHNTTYTIGATTSWEADIWGKLSKMKKSAAAQYMATQSYRDLVQTSLVSNIALTYYSLLALDEQLRVTKETIVLLRETVHTMEVLKESAITNGAAVEQSKSYLYAAEVSVPDIEKQIQSLENTLCLMVGRKASEIKRGSIEDQVIPTDVYRGVPSQMLARRPDVLQAELSFRAAFEATGAARASFYPSIAITGTLGYSKQNEVAEFFKPQNIIANIVGNIAQPIFAKKQLSTQLKVAKANQEEALLTFEQTVLRAGNEVSDALFDYQMAMRKEEIRTKQLDALMNSVDYTKKLLKYGDSHYTDVLIAEQNLLQAQLGEVNDKLQQLQAKINLYRALGGGLH